MHVIASPAQNQAGPWCFQLTTKFASSLAAGVLLLPLTYACEGQTSRFLKAVLLGSLAFFALLAGLVSVSPTRLAFDALSAVCGVACAAHVASIAAMIRSAYVNNRPRQALIFIFALASGNSLGVAMGCLAGGLVATKFGWRATFTAIAVVFACITVLSSYAMPGSPRAKVRLHDEKAVIAAALFPRDVSFPPLPAVGTLLVFLGVCFTALALAAGPEAVGGWSSPVVIVLLATGLLSFAGLALVLGPYPNLGKLGGKAHADKQLARRRYGANGTDARTGRTVHHAAIESREPIRR